MRLLVNSVNSHWSGKSVRDIMTELLIAAMIFVSLAFASASIPRPQSDGGALDTGVVQTASLR
jgi:hypothetical protein